MQDIKYTDLMKPEDVTVAKIWAVIEAVLFKGIQPSQVQKDEMRRTFFIGFSECFKVMTDMSEALSEDEASAVLSRLSAECNEFHNKEIMRLLPSRGNA